jgi:hypothetical protein
MKIRRDPRDRTKAEIRQVLENHSWLFVTGQWGEIDYDMLADLVTDLVYEARLYSPDEKNQYSPRVRVLRTVN